MLNLQPSEMLCTYPSKSLQLSISITFLGGATGLSLLFDTKFDDVQLFGVLPSPVQ